MNGIIFASIFGVILMLSSIFIKNKKTFSYLAITGIFIVFLVNAAELKGMGKIAIDTKGQLSFSSLGLFFNALLIAATFIYLLLNQNAILFVGKHTAEYYALLFFVLTGAFILTAYDNLLMLFLGIEILSIPLYILAGAEKQNLKSNEAALKYFLMGSFSTGILLMGIALMYGATGSFALAAVSKVQNLPGGMPLLELMGLLLIFVAFLFKVSAAPFHFWTPDVYDGSPTVFTSFMATIVKGAVFFALIKLFIAKEAELSALWTLWLFFVILLTLLIGNLSAATQTSFKKMLAYSSIAQAGFMLLALYGLNFIAIEGLIIYTLAYSLATVGCFALLARLQDHSIESFNGLAKQEPIVAFALTVCLLSLAGIPLTGGFFGKYYMLLATFTSNKVGSFAIVIIAILFSVVGVYYYFKVIQAMYFKVGRQTTYQIPITNDFKLGLLTLAALIIFIGIAPDLVLGWFYFTG